MRSFFGIATILRGLLTGCSVSFLSGIRRSRSSVRLWRFFCVEPREQASLALAAAAAAAAAAALLGADALISAAAGRAAISGARGGLLALLRNSVSRWEDCLNRFSEIHLG